MSPVTSRSIAKAAMLATVAGVGFAVSSAASPHARADAAGPLPPQHLAARRLRTRRGAVRPGTVVGSRALSSDRVFANSDDGFALADERSAQYPARTSDGGRTWRIDGPQVHIDAADGPEAVSYVGLTGPRTLFAYGSSVVDVTTDGGRTWWETLMGELVMAVVPGQRPDELVAYLQQSVSNKRGAPAVTWQYVSRDGGRDWYYSTALGG
jgi:hypothetical protein